MMKIVAMKIALKSVLEKVLASKNVADKKPIFEKYDQNVQGNTVSERKLSAANIISPFRDFPELDNESSRTSVAIACGGKPNFAKISARKAAENAVCEAVLKVSCVGAEPLCVTDCLNFGNPEKPDQMGEFVDALEGLKVVCKDLEVPIVSGNVSFYNESSGKSIPPSALISVFAKIANPDLTVSTEFKNAGEKIFLVGERKDQNLGGSEFLNIFEKNDSRIPETDFVEFLETTKKLQKAVKKGTVTSASPVLTGGSVVTILKSCFLSNLGASINIPTELSVPNFLFSENLAAVVTSSSPEKVTELFGENVLEIGEVTSDKKIKISHGEESVLDEDLNGLQKIWENSLREIF
ncbi:MAG: AIR synthase related protein [Candidatus Peregrinibacteria bacterium]|nr:AIR synthase related protein [Candidatus Peregrinibacteria bacterium]